MSTVTTYTDGYGRWHSIAPAGPDSYQLAANAIAGELLERAPRGTTFATMVDYVREELTASQDDCKQGFIHYVEYLIEGN